MCGIAGAVAVQESANWSSERLTECVRRMTAAIAHRGPDDHGFWLAPSGEVALGHRRLAIVDLSERGHQPMSYRDRFTIVFNGEIYNFRELRRDLAARGHTFHSGTDTEILMAAVLEWGIERALQALVGMFAFALWDARTQVLHLARDRLGEKPLFLGMLDGYLLFGSELRAIESAPGIDLKASPEALAQYLRHGYVPAPWTPWASVSKLPQATVMSVAVRGTQSARTLRYWSPAISTTTVPEEHAVDTLSALLDEAVRLQMQCDVPMGAFLSGGIDSTAVVAAMQAQSAAPVATFTVKFDAPGFDESEHAAAVARHLRTAHHEIHMSTAEILHNVPVLAASLDEPTANASYFPLHAMALAARQHVKVILTGDGGDELFGGYNRYRLTPSLWSRVGWMPQVMRRTLGTLVDHAPARLVDRLGAASGRMGLSGQVSSAVTLKKLARVLRSDSLAESYQRLMACWESPQAIAHVAALQNEPIPACTPDAFLRAASVADINQYLPDDNLAKSDRATMAAGLEARVPLLDHRIVEFAGGLLDRDRIRAGVSKWVLREVTYRRVPKRLLERPKMGFTVPLAQWLRGPLFRWADALLSSPALFDEGMFRRDAVARHWRAFNERSAPLAWEMWAIVMFAAWLDGRRAASSASATNRAA